MYAIFRKAHKEGDYNQSEELPESNSVSSGCGFADTTAEQKNNEQNGIWYKWTLSQNVRAATPIGSERSRPTLTVLDQQLHRILKP